MLGPQAGTGARVGKVGPTPSQYPVAYQTGVTRYAEIRFSNEQRRGSFLLEIIDFIAAGTTPKSVIEYRPSEEAQRWVEELIAREKEGHLSPEEKSELDHFMELEHIISMAKGRARQILQSGS